MNIIPLGKIVMAGLNSYFLDIERLCEYCHEVVGSCGIYFKSVSADGALFFDSSDYLGGGLRNSKANGYETIDVIEKLIEPASTDNFDITVYHIELEDVYYLASLFHAKSIYDGLKSEFTDLDALIKKMNTEKLTGYIEVIFDNVHSGDLFFRNGKIVHSNCNMTEDPPGDLLGSDRDLASLIYFSKKKAGIFNVKKIIMCQPLAEEKSAQAILPAFDGSRIYPMLESLLDLLKNVLSEKPPRGFNFDLTLRKKFIEKADKYDFLDPFAAEFQYNHSKVTYEGNADLKLVASAVFESAWELAVENGQSDRFEAKIEPVKKLYPKELAELGYNA